jgi:hypothetical protein
MILTRATPRTKIGGVAWEAAGWVVGMSGLNDPAFFDRYAHAYDDWTNPDPAPAVEFLGGLVPDGGRALELASGTGRVAIPLAARGVAVEGTTLRPLRLRYCWPSELDLMAELAGMRLRERYADWHRTPFTAASRSHVSVYERNERT